MNSLDVETRLRAHVEHLAGILGERNPSRYESLEAARLYIERSFREAEYEIRHDIFQAARRDFRNVIAEEPGTNPARRLIIGAHYDTASGTPGADDNASAVAVLLELARLLRNSSPRLTLRWVAFCLEEPPHFGTSSMGSWVHAKQCRERGERLDGMFSLEMVGYYREEPGSQRYPLPLMRWFYPDRGDFIAVAGNFRSRRLVRKLARGLLRSDCLPVESNALPFVPGVGLSDNWSFWREGYAAAMITDTAFYRNPHYHLASDLPDTLDYRRMAGLVQGLSEALLQFD